MSIQTFEESAWEASGLRLALRRTGAVIAVALLLGGPFFVGGALGWMATREPGPVLGDDGWLRSRTPVAGLPAGSPLISAAELAAAGISVAEATQVLR